MMVTLSLQSIIFLFRIHRVIKCIFTQIRWHKKYWETVFSLYTGFLHVLPRALCVPHVGKRCYVDNGIIYANGFRGGDRGNGN